MKLSELITEDKIIPRLTGVIKEDIINELIDLFKNDERVYDIEALRQEVLKREKLMSTGIGAGYAVPHCTTDVIEDFIVAFGRSETPIDFESIDLKPVQIFFFIAGKDLRQHMRFLGKVTRLMNGKAKEKIIRAKTTGEIRAVFFELEKENQEIIL